MFNKHFQKEFTVRYYELNKYQQATPVAILNYLEEAAIAHSETIGYGVGVLKEQALGWVLNRWILEMDRYPCWGENITIETWPSKFERFYATREFYIKDDNEVIIGRATSLWIFLNIHKKRPLRIPVEIIEGYGVDQLRAIDVCFSNTELQTEADVTKEFTVKRVDIDSNEHVNNARYIEWIMETVPPETYHKFRLKSLSVEYKHESRYGDTITANCQSVNGDNTSRHHFLHSIYETTSEKVLAIAETMWQQIT